jgi:hypothetical protein
MPVEKGLDTRIGGDEGLGEIRVGCLPHDDEQGNPVPFDGR